MHSASQSLSQNHSHDAQDRALIRAAILTVSDTRETANDVGGGIIAQTLTEAGHVVASRQLVRDDQSAITVALSSAVEAGVDLIVTTGGTGIAARDVTYEVVIAFLDKKLDGFGEAFRRLSWDQVGARSILSRAVAGTHGRALVVALPGSPKGVELAMKQLVLPLVQHAVGLLRGA